MTTTSSVYYNRINTGYPQAGKDNDSQIFRDNFTNIRQALQATDEVVDSLRLGLVTSTASSDFNFNTVKRVNLENHSFTVNNDDTVRSQTVTVNYAKGNYQKFKVAPGSTSFTISNWPTLVNSTTNTVLGGRIVISITPDSENSTTLNFPNCVTIGETVLPYEVNSTSTVFFEAWSDDSGSTIYINKVGQNGNVVATGTDLIAYNSVKIGSNTISTGSEYTTMIKNDAGTMIGNIATHRDVFSSTISGTLIDPVALTTNTFNVSPGDRILPGATFVFTGTTTVYVVDSVIVHENSATVKTTDEFIINPWPVFKNGDGIQFINPVFNDQKLVSTYRTTAVTTTTGVVGDLRGEFYATTNTMFVSFSDYGAVSENWVLFESAQTTADKLNYRLSNTISLKLASTSTAVTQPITNNTTTIATTQFIHSVLPKGVIMMWYGDTTDIPAGWALCNGQNNTPNLSDQFVVAAGSNYTAHTFGGSADSIVVAHSHTASTAEAGSHSHTFSAYAPNVASGNFVAQDPGGDQSVTITTAPAGAHTHNVTVDEAGVSGIGANLPPYYALCYIMKITG